MQHLKHHYSHSLKALGDRLHFSAHSHHLWPDITKAAHLKYWEDSAELIDKKWDHILGNVLVEAQRNISEFLNVTRYQDVFFASNTHDIIIKIFSALGFGNKKLKVLSTNGEFHSFSRQARAWVESGLIELDLIDVKSDYSHEDIILQKLKDNKYDIVFVSHVFFQTGLILNNLEEIFTQLSNSHLIIDGYHSVGSFPVKLSFLDHAENVFYIGGGYKYLQAGEAACFCLTPYKHQLKPHITGWFAQFGELQNTNDNQLNYATGGGAFGGATFDPSGLYRFNAAYKLMKDHYSIDELREYILELKNEFINLFHKQENLLSHCLLVEPDINKTGSFLSFQHPKAIELSKKLFEHGVFTDARDQYLRFGFGVYQDKKDIHTLFKNILYPHKPL